MMRNLFHVNMHKNDNGTREYIQAQLDLAKTTPHSKVILEPGTYIISSPLAKQTMADVISGKHGENPQDDLYNEHFDFTEGLSLEGHKGTTLSAYGVTLLIDGFMEPLCLKNCQDITVEGLTIDYKRKPYSKGIITQFVQTDKKEKRFSMEVKFLDAYPVDENTIMPRYCAYDARTARFDMDMEVTKRTYTGNQTYTFDIVYKNDDVSLVGQEFYVWHCFHYRPAILIEDAINTHLQDVTIHSQPGMGIVGHRNTNVLLERLKVVPSHKEHLSTNTDATHFTSCKGDLTFLDCVFDGHGDDATNVHTFYHLLNKVNSNTFTSFLERKPHSLTTDYPDEGDTLELVNKHTLELIDTFKVIACTPHHESMCYTATLDHDLPQNDLADYWVSNVSALPKLTFKNCTTNNHWARSVLIKTRNVLVEDCVFTSATLYAIHIAAESFWREGVACENVTIKNNRFYNCGITGHIEIGGIKVEMQAEIPTDTQQKNIVIENNIFHLPQVDHAISISNAQDIVLRNNTYFGLNKEPVLIKDCKNINQDNAQ